MLVGIDMEGSDRDVNVQPTQRLSIAQLDWMKRVAANLKAMGGVVEAIEECAWKERRRHAHARMLGESMHGHMHVLIDAGE